jgi:hypothetical protein
MDWMVQFDGLSLSGSVVLAGVPEQATSVVTTRSSAALMVVMTHPS